MSEQKTETDYKGFEIYTHTSGSRNGPYKASYNIYKDGNQKQEGVIETTFTDQEKGFEAAYIAAHKWIDEQNVEKQ